VKELLLIVDDDPNLRDLLDDHLRREGYRITQAASGSEALARAAAMSPDLMLLDLNLPDVSGLDVCKQLRLRPATRELLVLMLSARSSEADRIAGLEAGADDYLTKPFSVRELVLRVGSLLKRRPERELVTAGPIEIDCAALIVRVDGREVTLTQTELRLLRFLVDGAGRVRSRRELVERVLEQPATTETRAIETHIKRLRAKLGDAGERIETVRAVGYRLRR
jgi:two-component system phosphate regulon response regulator PhoB